MNDEPSSSDDTSVPAGGGRPRSGRADPAAMRAELDAARRHLGNAPSNEPPRSAERQRALLREAAANQVGPAMAEGEHRSTGATAPEPDPATESDPPDPPEQQ